MFIAAALEQHNDTCSSKAGKRGSTILVAQHKNKFNCVVVCCDLANSDLVKAAWKDDGHDGEPTEEYIADCFVRDAVVYRRTYRSMLALVPQHRDMILARPDYPLLLLDTKAEFDHRLDAGGKTSPFALGPHTLHQIYDRADI